MRENRRGILAIARERRWFAVYTTCRHEKRVAQHLEQREIEHFLPIYRTQHTWKDGSRVMVDLPLVSGICFCSDRCAEEGWRAGSAGSGFDDRNGDRGRRRCLILKWKPCERASIQ